MSAWTVWQIISGAPERMGPFGARGDALRVFRTTAKRRSAVFFGAERREESEDLSVRDGAAMDAAVRAWLARTTPSAPAAVDVVEIPDPAAITVGPEDFGGTDFPDDVADAALRLLDARTLGVGAATEPPARVEAPLPVAFDAPVVEADEVQALHVALADANARAVAAEEATARMQSVLDAVRTNTEALDTRAARAEAERDDLAAALRERSTQVDAARAELAAAQHDVAHWKESYAQLAAGVTQDLTGETGMLATSDACARIRALRTSLDAARERIDELEGQQLAGARATEHDELDKDLSVTLARLAGRDIASLRSQLAQRDRTIANLRAELAGAQAHAHPVVRIPAPRARRVVREETPIEALHRRLAEIAEGRR